MPCQLKAAASSSKFFYPICEALQRPKSWLNLVKGAGHLYKDAACQNPIDQIIPT